MLRGHAFQGVLTALVTPMRDGALDEEALRRLVADQLAGGVDGLVPCGTTGEGATLRPDEVDRVLRVVVDEARGRVPVVAGCGTNSTSVTIENVRRAKAAGCQAALVVTPYYNKPPQEGLFRHFECTAKDGGLPIVLYNVPGRTGVDLLAPTVARLARVPGIVAVKEASGSAVRTLEIVEALEGRPFDILSGDDALYLPLLACGAAGVVSVASNIVPERMAAIGEAFAGGDHAKALAAQTALGPLVRALFCETSPAPCKAALAMLGRMRDELRLPLVPAGEAAREKLRAALAGLGLPT